MATLSILYWRDIPAQVIAKQGRKTAKRVLSERFEQAIDRCAMRVGARDTDAYLAEWRKGEAKACSDDLETEAETRAAELEAEFSPERLKSIVEAGGQAA